MPLSELPQDAGNKRLWEKFQVLAGPFHHILDVFNRDSGVWLQDRSGNDLIFAIFEDGGVDITERNLKQVRSNHYAATQAEQKIIETIERVFPQASGKLQQPLLA